MINMGIRGHHHKWKDADLISLPRSMIVWEDHKAMLKKLKNMETISSIIYSLKGRL
jgi:hypothetical protein